MTSCLKLINNYTEISNNKYIFNNKYDTSYGLYDNSNNNYLVKGIPRNYPLTFFSYTDISHIITFKPINDEPIIIYVSKGLDISFNNGDYFRLYDACYQLLNINSATSTNFTNTLTDVSSNFYFMNNRSYKFIATQDFCNNFPFSISGQVLQPNTYTLNTSDTSFIITIPNNADNSNNRLFYSHNDNHINTRGNLYILKDISNLSYYYGDISFSIKNYNNFSNTQLSIKSYDFSYSLNNYGNKDVSNTNIFYYSNFCKYIIDEIASPNTEYLNRVSAIDISINGTSLSFNKGNHSKYNNNFYDLSFVLGKGDYIIIDICENYPIRLLNQDISNLIFIDTTYQTTRRESVPFNNNIYYYGSFKIKVINDFSSVGIEILNKTANTPKTFLKKFIYSDTNHISYNNVLPNSVLQLINQQNNTFNLNESTTINNIYDLKLDTNYIEKDYISNDKYGNNLYNLVTVIPPIESIDQEITNNLANGFLNILYSVYDYENNLIRNIRRININKGPIIEISSNYFTNNGIYQNNNQYNKILLFENNIFNSNYNFYNNINVYIYDTSRQKINIPFEITLSGEYYNNDTNRNIRQANSNNLFRYPDLQYLSQNSYASFNQNLSLNLSDTNSNIQLTNIATITFDNSYSKYYFTSINTNQVISNTNNNIINYTSASSVINSIYLKNYQGNSIPLTGISQNFDSSFVTIKFNLNETTANTVNTVNVTLKINNYSFDLSFITAISANNLKINGTFKNPIFFGPSNNKLIDISNVGNYDLTISTKSLSSGDYFYDTYKDNRFYDKLITNIEKTYKIIVQDISSPQLTFYDISGKIATNLTKFIHYFPQTRKFNALTDICFVNLKTISNFEDYKSQYVYNKPLLLYRDDSIYDVSLIRDLSIAFTQNSNVTRTNYELSLNTLTDTSYSLSYYAKDLCNNYSQRIELQVNFVNIPNVELSGNAIENIAFNKSYIYRDAGLINDISFVPDTSYTFANYATTYNKIYPVKIGSYDISYSSDLNLSRIGDYYFNYFITISNGLTKYPLNLRRLLKVRDLEQPFFLFPDLSNLKYINHTTTGLDQSYNDISNNRTKYSVDSSFNIDLSFTVFTSIYDLSRVLYNFDVSDNYFPKSQLIPSITFNSNVTPFQLSDISNYYDSSNKLNKVTTQPLKFTYNVRDGCYNSFSLVRKISIVDITLPTIEFSFNNYRNDFSYVYFSNTDFSYIDFSYVALSSANTNFNLIQELSSILFNFTLSDDLSINSNNYAITISNSSFNNIITKNNINALNTSLFSRPDTSFDIIYDFSDNQSNKNRQIRKVKIIDLSSNFDISFLNNSSSITISFGDTNFNILNDKDVSLNHKRLLSSDISYDISYSFQNPITSLSGSYLYDPSGLIYNIGSTQVTYFPKSLPSATIIRTIDICNNGPIIYLPSGEIIHEIYTPLSDASLIFGVTSTSLYDKFYYSNYKKDLSYNGTNFSVTYDDSLNLLEPSFGNYTVNYSSTDLYGITNRKSLTLRVGDRSGPIITICGDLYYNLSYNLSGDTYLLNYDTSYIEYGAYSYDIGTNKRTNDISLSYQKQYLTNTSTNASILTDISFTDISFSNLSNSDIDKTTYIINYFVSDSNKNSTTKIRYIKIGKSKKPILYPYIETNNNGTIQKYYLSSNFQINERLPNTVNKDIYDLSLSFIYTNTNKLIICEAVKPIVFRKLANINYIKFKLDATNYNAISLSSEYINVDYNIDSLRVYNNIDYQKITFYARDITQLNIDQINYEELNLKIIDTNPPIITLLSNVNFKNAVLDYPLLSGDTYSKLIRNIDSFDNFNNKYNKYERFYSLKLVNDTSYIHIYDPGIRIKDIVDGEVDYIDNSFQKINDISYTFLKTDISINYYKSDLTRIDISNLLINSLVNSLDLSYNQVYSVKDTAKNDISSSRIINVKKFPPFINLNYQKDCCFNIFTTYFHKLYEKYEELGGSVRDYYYDTISFENVIINKENLNENSLGSYKISYSVSNDAYITNEPFYRKIDVIKILPLERNKVYDFSNLLGSLGNNSYTKLGVANGTYKFDLVTDKAFRIFSQDFNIGLGVYDISNLAKLTSDSSLNINSIKYYYNNVSLTISGDFNRLSIQFSDTKLARDLFVYDNESSYINLKEHLKNLESHVIIDASYDVTINNINNSILKPSYILNYNGSIINNDLNLSIGNYRFYQSGSINFHNPIKFSITPDGKHRGGIEYTKNVFRKNLPGTSIINRNSSYIQINIDGTTPSILYYYCENFPNMGGKIQMKNNIIFSKNVIILNNTIIDSNNANLLDFTPTNPAYNNEFMKNRLLFCQRFVDTTKNSSINITCITQQNLQHNILYNINSQPDKIIFKKYESLQDRQDISYNSRSILLNNSSNYLVESATAIGSIINYNFTDTYITYFNYEFLKNISIIPSLNIYDRSLKNLFYNANNYNFLNNANNTYLNEILNYSDFFKKGYLSPENLILNDFNYKINEFLFANSSNILNLDDNYVSNSFLKGPRIKITNIIDNYVFFRIYVYYNDYDILNNNVNDSVLFETFDFIVYSDKFVTYLPQSTTISSKNFITLFDGSITFTNNLLYSKTQNEDFSKVLFDSSIFDSVYYDEIANGESDFEKDLILLNINSLNNLSSICGLTKQNLYNNMYFDENKTLIFHKYNETSIVNYQVNSPNLLLKETLKYNSNNDRYLIDICINDIYNSFNFEPLFLNFNIIRDLCFNSLNVNDLSNDEYNISINYNIQNELTFDDTSFRSVGLDPIYLNNIPIYKNEKEAIYRNNSIISDYNRNVNKHINEISYNNFSNQLHSYSYIIDLNDYFDLPTFKKTIATNSFFSTNDININNLVYKLIDLSFVNKFNLWDVAGSQNIVYDKTNINVLTTIQNKIFTVNFKLIYMINIIKASYPNSINYDLNIPIINTSDSIQYYVTFLNNFATIVNNYTSTIESESLNFLYTEIFYNTRLLLTKYNEIIDVYDIRNFYTISIPDFFNNLIEFNSLIIDKIDNSIRLLDYNVENIINNMFYLHSEDNLINSLAFLNIYNPIITFKNKVFTFTDITNLEFCFNNFYSLNNKLEYMRKEVKVRTDFTDYFNQLATYNNQIYALKYRNLFNSKNLNVENLFDDLSFNYNLLNKNFILDSSYILQYYYDASIPYNDLSINDYTTLYNNVYNLYSNISGTFNRVSRNYNILDKPVIYINSYFVLEGSKILINSFLSNNIAMKFKITYSSYYYQEINLNNILLDIIIPDVTPPTIIFKNNDISFSESMLTTDASVNQLIGILINDISYIDLNQTHNFEVETTNSFYIDDSFHFNVRDIYSVIEIDLNNVSNINYDNKEYKDVDIIYYLIDNANNVSNYYTRNFISRIVRVYKDFATPKFYYNEKPVDTDTDTDTLPDLLIEQNITKEQFINELIANIQIVNPRFIDLSGIVYALKTENLIGLNSITITFNNDLIATYFDYLDGNFEVLAYDELHIPTTNFVLDNGGYYKLVYTSNITNGRTGTISRNLTVTPFISPVIADKVTHCCYPKVEYKEIQHNYKLGSQNATVMKFAKFIINRNR